MTDPKRIPVYTMPRPELDGLTLVEKMQVLISAGYGWEDVSVILDVRRQYVRQFMFGKKMP